MKARLKRRRRAIRKQHKKDDFTYWIMWGESRRPELAKPLDPKRQRRIDKMMRQFKRCPPEEDWPLPRREPTPEDLIYFRDGVEHPTSDLPERDEDGDLLTHYFDMDRNYLYSAKYF